MIAEQEILSAKQLTKTYPRGISGDCRAPAAVQDISLAFRVGETLALVGESGSGKTTLGKLLAGHLRPDSGRVEYLGNDIGSMNRRRWQRTRADIQMVFQNHASALNPRQTVGGCLLEALRVRNRRRDGDLMALCAAVELKSDLLSRYPVELSSGQRQRVNLARALAVQPRILIADEPTANLDAGLRDRIMVRLMRLKAQFRLTLIIISHDIAVVSQLADRLAVMYRGRLIELGETARLLYKPAHPYTGLLFSTALGCSSAVPQVAPQDGLSVVGDDSGCCFAAACPRAEPRCLREAPVLSAFSEEQGKASGLRG